MDTVLLVGLSFILGTQLTITIVALLYWRYWKLENQKKIVQLKKLLELNANNIEQQSQSIENVTNSIKKLQDDFGQSKLVKVFK